MVKLILLVRVLYILFSGLCCLAGAALYMIFRVGKPDPTMVANGLLAGLVAITAPSGFVGATSGFIIGAIAGVLVCVFIEILDRLKIDDQWVPYLYMAFAVCGAYSPPLVCSLTARPFTVAHGTTLIVDISEKDVETRLIASLPKVSGNA